jgi:hypothetical protein
LKTSRRAATVAQSMPSPIRASAGPPAAARARQRQSLERRSAVATGPAAELTRVAWTPHGDVGLAQWAAVGRRFGEIGRCSQWWLGDWILYGNQRFGERYTRAVKLTGYDVQSLMNMVYVASRFVVSRRRESLSWSHHAALAAMDVAEQERWLDRAGTERLSVADLRVALRSHRRGPTADAPDRQLPAPADEKALVCPNCGGRVPLSA